MKRIYSLVAMLLILSLAACGTDNTPEASVEETTPAITAEAKQQQSDNETVPVITGDADIQAPAAASEESETVTLVYGTASLTYDEFYAGDVSSTDGFDAVSSATVKKYEIMGNMYTDFVDEASNADGYHILGVKGVQVAIDEKQAEAYKAINPSFEVSAEVFSQYKPVSIENGSAVYGATVYNVVDTVEDAEAVLLTNTNWGDYQINVTDGEKKYLRTERTDEGFEINSLIQGVILETASGHKVGMEYLQSIWVQPYEVSFNVLSNNTHNTRISGYDNLSELSKLVGENITKITYIMPEGTYEYKFGGIYVKPQYEGEAVSSTLSGNELTLSTDDFSSLVNPVLTVTYTIGAGREAKRFTLFSSAVNGAACSLDTAEADAEEAKDGTYTAVLSSDNYADIDVFVPATEAQLASLNAAIALAEEALAGDSSNEALISHLAEAGELIEDNAGSSEIAAITRELISLSTPGEQNGGH